MLLLALVSTPAEYLPCRAGITIEYRLESKGEDSGTRVTDVIVGEERRLCRIDRTIEARGKKPITEAYAREMLPDRILAAGYVGALIALRPPLLVEPVATGTTWQFNRARYRIVSVGPCDVAGSSLRCVVVDRTGIGKAAPALRTTYAFGVGLVEERDGPTKLTAIRFSTAEVPKGVSAEKSRAPATD